MYNHITRSRGLTESGLILKRSEVVYEIPWGMCIHGYCLTNGFCIKVETKKYFL